MIGPSEVEKMSVSLNRCGDERPSPDWHQTFWLKEKLEPSAAKRSFSLSINSDRIYETPHAILLILEIIRSEFTGATELNDHAAALGGYKVRETGWDNDEAARWVGF